MNYGMFMQPNMQMDMSQKGPKHPTQGGGSSFEKNEIEQKTKDLILMTGGKGPRRWRQRKGEYLHKLEEDNDKLNSLIVEEQQQISALKAQNDILRDQLSYFQSCLAQAAPMVLQQNHEQAKQ